MKFTTAAVIAAAASVVAGWRSPQEMMEKLRGLHASRAEARLSKRGYGGPSEANHKFYNEKTSKFYVNTTVGSLPQVTWETSESYSGLMPISADKDESRQLFFWFWPSTGGKETEDDLVIWLNGGPGCSSLEGFMQENGPISWKQGTNKPVPNPYSWTNLTNMVWVEQPVGTGFSQGKPNIKSEEDLVVQFMGFWKQLMETFDGLKGKKIYVTGESYAGAYVPYITNGFYDAKDTDYYNAHGMMINDPVIDDGDYLQWQTPVYPFAANWKDMLALEDGDLAQLEDMHHKCGYEQMYNDAMTFPPKGPIAVPTQLKDPKFADKYCDANDLLSNAATTKNPCFNVYEISTTCPNLYDPLDFSGTSGSSSYFNLPAVQDAIHAPRMTWNECAQHAVFTGGPRNRSDTSRGTALKQLPECIAKGKRTIIANGDLDFILMSEGTLMAIQNMTWGGKQGFQEKPSKRITVEYEGQGDMGSWTEERGLTWAQVKLSGHMLPGYQPGAGYKLLQYLLGRIDTLTGGLPGVAPASTSAGSDQTPEPTATASATTAPEPTTTSVSRDDGHFAARMRNKRKYRL